MRALLAVTAGWMAMGLISGVCLAQADRAGPGAVWAHTADPGQRPPAPPREFRGAWVATVANIDWPSKRGLPAEEQRREALAILDKAAELNLNALVLQVRPTADAIFPSTLEPWSEFLTGESGKPPSDGYDPLAFWVSEAHKRGIQLHAWFNPFRARHFDAKLPDAQSHISKTRPDLVRTYDRYLWLDPGEEEAQTHSLRVIMDVVNRYDIDGVHFDDYFYPYPEKDKPFPDDAPYQRYKASGGKLERDAWRRSNIDRFVKTVHDQVKAAKPHVMVGISPFGIWRPGFPPGVQGFDAYANLHADARMWLREGWLDYIAPQLYWKVDAPQQRYDRLLAWWLANNDQRRHVWPGNFTSRILAAEPEGAPPAADRKGRESWEAPEILRQIEITREQCNRGESGNIHFSFVALLQNRRGIADALKSGPYARPALPPAIAWSATAASPDGHRLLPAPVIKVAQADGRLTVEWTGNTNAQRWVFWTRTGTRWEPTFLLGESTVQSVPANAGLTAVAVQGIDRFGIQGDAGVVTPQQRAAAEPAAGAGGRN